MQRKSAAILSLGFGRAEAAVELAAWILAASVLRKAEQIPDTDLVLHRHMQIAARDAHFGGAVRIANLGKRSSAG
jgi:hypothetical protein